MVSWELFLNTANFKEWDILLSNTEDNNVFQSYVWGEYKRASGWLPMRYVVRNKDGAVVAMAQILVKSLPAGIKIGWVPGGPVFYFPQSKEIDHGKMVSALIEKVERLSSNTFIRLNSLLLNNFDMAYTFNRYYVKPFFKLNSGYSIWFDLREPIDMLNRKMTSHHRYYVKKGLAQNIQWRAGNDAQFLHELLTIHTEMVMGKKMESLKSNLNDISNLCHTLGKSATIFTGYLNGDAISSCLVLTFGQKAFYLMAATGRKGRKISASYAMVFNLFKYLKEEGIIYFDFGGVDPGSNIAEGVNHFKKGFGGRLVEYLGEWEWASAEWLRWGINFAIWHRGGRL